MDVLCKGGGGWEKGFVAWEEAADEEERVLDAGGSLGKSSIVIV